jgi:hypothetical protein
MRRAALTAPRSAAVAAAALVVGALVWTLVASTGGTPPLAPTPAPVAAEPATETAATTTSVPEPSALAEPAPVVDPAVDGSPIVAVSDVANGPLVVIGTQGDRNGESPVGWYALSALGSGPCDGGCLEPFVRCPEGDGWCGAVTSFDFSRDGRLLAVAVTSLSRDHPANGIHVIDLATGRDTLIRRCEPTVECVWVDLAWSPDTARLAFAVHSPAPGNRRLRNGLGIVAADGSSGTDLLHTDGARSPTWSPTGDRIAFESPENGGGIDVMAPDGFERMRLVDGGRTPAWSPDGTTIAYACGSALALVRPDGTDATPSPRLPCRTYGRGGRPVWSPDGTRLAIVVEDGVDVMFADGSNLRRRTTHAPRGHVAGEDAAWRPVMAQ